MRVLVAALWIGVISVPLTSGQDAPKLPATLAKRVDWEKDIKDVPVSDLLSTLGKRYGVKFVVADDHFKAAGVKGIRDAKVNVPVTQLKDASLGTFLDIVLNSIGATYVVRPDGIEITTPAARLQEKVERVFPKKMSARHAG